VKRTGEFKEKQFERYLGNFIIATIPFKGTISDEILDLNGKLDDYSVHMFASKKFLKSPTMSFRIIHSAIPLGLNIFGTLRGGKSKNYGERPYRFLITNIIFPNLSKNAESWDYYPMFSSLYR